MTRDSLYLVSGITVFIIAFILLLLITDLSLVRIIGISFLLSVASDAIIILDNEKRNAAPDAKFHHRNELVGEIAQVQEIFRVEGDTAAGKIRIRGETWKARSDDPDLQAGDRVRIIDRVGMTFTVEKIRHGA